jgi:hypothetical protein
MVSVQVHHPIHLGHDEILMEPSPNHRGPPESLPARCLAGTSQAT